MIQAIKSLSNQNIEELSSKRKTNPSYGKMWMKIEMNWIDKANQEA